MKEVTKWSVVELVEVRTWAFVFAFFPELSLPRRIGKQHRDSFCHVGFLVRLGVSFVFKIGRNNRVSAALLRRSPGQRRRCSSQYLTCIFAPRTLGSGQTARAARAWKAARDTAADVFPLSRWPTQLEEFPLTFSIELHDRPELYLSRSGDGLSRLRCVVVKSFCSFGVSAESYLKEPDNVALARGSLDELGTVRIAEESRFFSADSARRLVE